MRCLLLGAAVWLVVPAAARGDGGTVRLAQQRGGYRITVFTDPTPLRVGLIDVSVLVQDAETGKPLPHVPATVRAMTEDGTVLEIPATAEGATNKLLRAATLHLMREGRWRFEVTVDGQGPVTFAAEVASPPPAWAGYALWIGWPVIPIALFVLSQWGIRRGRVPCGTGGSRRSG
jgi:hypothetical protein